MLKNRFRAGSLIATSLLSSAALVTSAQADSSVIQWTTGTGANNAYYQRIDSHSNTPLTFSSAAAAAAAMTFNTGTQTLVGKLAVFDINYTNAFTFVRDNVVYGATGSGAAPGSALYWVGAVSPTGNQPPNDAGNSDWTWVNGAVVPDSVASGWNIDHAEGSGTEGIGYFAGASNGTLWDYIASAPNNLAYGYVVEFTPVPEPMSLGLLAICGVVLTRRRRRNHL